jgi:NADH:ubiquinone oxidoreductase subunit 3 (subunit A)
MSESGLHAYAPLLIHLIIAVALASALTAASILVGWKRPNRAKQQAYECGVEPVGDARAPFSVKFYLVAMVFILFDVEAIFLYPWAYIYRDMFKISHLHRHPPGRIHLSVEKRRVRLASLVGAKRGFGASDGKRQSEY